MGEFKTIKLSKIRKNGYNYKEEDYILSQKLKENIRMNGVIGNLVVRSISNGYEIIDGAHRYDVLKDLNIKEVMCYDTGEISDNYAKRLCTEINETKFPTDSVKLAELIQGISTEFDMDSLVETMPFSKDELSYFIEGFGDYDFGLDDNGSDPEISDNVNQKAVFKVKCDNIAQLAEVQQYFNTEGLAISFTQFKKVPRS